MPNVTLFDASYYLLNNPDVVTQISLGVFRSAEDHYARFGAKENRSPNSVFDAKYYAANNADVLNAVSAGRFASVFDHYKANGLAENRSPNASLAGFNGTDYLARNPDIAPTYTATTAIQHYVLYGNTEGRSFTSSTAGSVTGNVSGTTADDTVTPAGGQANTVRVEGGQQGAGGDTLVVTSGSASSFQVIDLSLNTGDQNQTRDNTTAGAGGAKVGPVVQGFENVDARQATINMNLTAIDRTSITNTGGVASTQTGSVLQGGTGRDTLAGNAGNDVITGNDGNDQITGAAGNDTLSGGVGDDNIGGGAGADVITDGAGNDTVTGDAGADTITVEAGTNSIDGGADNDTINVTVDQATSTTVSTISGGTGDDTITLGASVGTAASAVTAASRTSVAGGQGNDTIIASLGVETVNAGAGNDTIRINTTNLGATDMFNGNDGQDIIQLEIPTGAGTNTFVFAPGGTTTATSQFAGFEAIALIDSSGNTNAKQYKLNLTDTFVANNLVNGSFLIDARGLPGGSNLVIDFSGLTAASAARFTAGTFRVLTSPSTDVRDQNNVTITAAYSVQTGNALLNNVTAFNVFSGDTTITAGTAAAYNTDRTVNTGTGQATYTTTGGTAETGSGTTTYNFTQTTGTSAVLTTTLNNGFGSGFLTSGADLINSSTFLASGNVIADATTGDADRLDMTLSGGTNIAATIANIETLNINSFLTAGTTFSFANVTGATAINVTGTNFAAIGVASGTTFNLTNIFGAQNYQIAANATTALTFNLSGVSSGSTLTVSDNAGAGTVETVNLNLLNNATLSFTGTAAGSTVNVTGSGTATLTHNDALSHTFSASTLSGLLAYTQGAAAAVSIVGSAGNDTFSFNSTGTLTTNDTINGGAGTDTISYSSNLAANGLDSVTNVEIINLTGTGANTYTTVDTLVAFGQTLTVNAGSAGSLTWDGSAELNGAFSITGSTGSDSLVGGSNTDTLILGNGADTANGGLGNDTINATETTASVDSIRFTSSGSSNVDTVTGFAITGTRDVVGFTIGNITETTTGTVTLSTANGTDVGAAVAANAATVAARATGDAATAAGNTVNLLFLSTASTSFANAIGANGFTNGAIDADLTTASEGVATVWFDSATNQAVFGYVRNTTAAGNVLNNADTFVEVARVGIASSDYTQANVTAAFELF